jgi:FtsP/CotA-like multicopper oxidase with cupredoxin domain
MEKKYLKIWLTLIVFLALGIPASYADRPDLCVANMPTSPPWGQVLQDPPSISPGSNGVLDTQFVVQKKLCWVPYWNSTTWEWTHQWLRSYGFPKNPANPIDPEIDDDPNTQWGYPGPSLKARKMILSDPTKAKGASGNSVVSDGTRVKILLYNRLPNNSFSAMQCEETYLCKVVEDGEEKNEACTNNDGQWTCPDATGSACKPLAQAAPNCFHGPDVTNLHYHGTHVSPQPPQDFVLLKLYSKYQTNPAPEPASQDVAIGQYQTDINPLPWNQAPGTHWYHPHKHGSTATQVLNGMAGPLLISGEFDDWLYKLYGNDFVERVMVLQEIAQDQNFFKKGVEYFSAGTVLINGYATPRIQMRPGEVQRWRFIGATQQVSAALEIGFDERVNDVYQIAQDGVQFAWQNYVRQPFRDSSGPFYNFPMSPGNRADFLIKAPAEPGIYTTTSRTVVPNIGLEGTALRKPSPAIEKSVPPQLKQLAKTPPVDQNGDPLLFVIEVLGSPKPMALPVTQQTDPNCISHPKPLNCWPDTPEYLQDIDIPDPKQPVHTMAFSMQKNRGAPPSFYINNTQYASAVAGATMTLNRPEDWEISNEMGTDNTVMLPHPYHIHINPFQVIRNSDRVFQPPYVWQDTIALPVPDTRDQLAGPIWNQADAPAKCNTTCNANNATWNGEWKTTVSNTMSVCGCVQNSPSVLIRQEYADYTGAFVIHCHFLGHEDRGMMLNVQTVCPDSDKAGGKFGLPIASGGHDNCAMDSTFIPNPLEPQTFPSY